MTGERIIGPMTAAATIEQLREELATARASAQYQRHAAKNARQLLRRLEARHRRGDRQGAVWLLENWESQLQKWSDEAIAGSRL